MGNCWLSFPDPQQVWKHRAQAAPKEPDTMGPGLSASSTAMEPGNPSFPAGSFFFFLLIFLISFFSPFFFSIKQAQAYRVCLAGLRHVLWLLRAVDFSPQHFPSVCPQSIPVALPSSHPTLGMVQDCSRQIQLTEQLLGFLFFGFFLEKGS